jgi:hypothetical protein
MKSTVSPIDTSVIRYLKDSSLTAYRVKAQVLLSARDIAIQDLSFSVRFEIIGPVELAS